MRALALTQREGVRDRCRSVVSDYTVEKASKGIRDAFQQVIHPMSTQ
jgi:hypothetical protein